MKIRIIKDRQIPLSLLWGFYVFTYILFSSSDLRYEIASVSNWLSYCQYLIVIFQVIIFLAQRKFNKRSILLYLFAIAVTLAIEINITSKELIIFVLFILLATQFDVERLVFWDIKIKIFTFCFIEVLLLLGFVQNYSGFFSGTFKQSLGFSHPNVLCCYLFSLILEIMYAYYEKIRLWHTIVIFAVAYLIYRIGGSRTSFYMFVLVMILFLISKMIPSVFKTRGLCMVFLIMTPILTMLSFYLLISYINGDTMAETINQFLSGRLRMAAYYYEQYAVNAFGQAFRVVSNRMAELDSSLRARPFDMAYLKYTLQYGVVYIVLINIFYIVGFYRILKNGNIRLAIFSIGFCVMAFAESSSFELAYNISFMLIMAYVIQGDRIKSSTSVKPV